jgi:hypothetical protein
MNFDAYNRSLANVRSLVRPSSESRARRTPASSNVKANNPLCVVFTPVYLSSRLRESDGVVLKVTSSSAPPCPRAGSDTLFPLHGLIDENTLLHHGLIDENTRSGRLIGTCIDQSIHPGVRMPCHAFQFHSMRLYPGFRKIQKAKSIDRGKGVNLENVDPF